MMMSKKILICDDELHMQEALSFISEKEGYRAIIAEDGEEGLEKAKKEKPALILLDIMLPKKDGYHVCQELKNDPETKGTYIIMLTARGQESDEQKGFEVGADEYMRKPFSPVKLARRFHEILD